MVRRVALLAALLISGPLSSIAAADLLPAVTTRAGGSSLSWRGFIGTNQSATAGWSFTVKAKNLRVTSLGLFGPASLAAQHPVGLWTDEGVLLASTTVKAANGSALVGDYRYETIPQVTLLAGQTYRLGAYFPVASQTVEGDTLRIRTPDTIAPALTFNLAMQTRAVAGPGSGLAFPDIDARVEPGVFGPSLRYAAFAIGGEAGGIGAPGLVLQLDDDLRLAVDANGAFTFPKQPDGSSYRVTVLSSPPGQSCAVTGGGVTLAGADVSSIRVACTTAVVDAGGDADATPDASVAPTDGPPPTEPPPTESSSRDAGAPLAASPESAGCDCNVGLERNGMTGLVAACALSLTALLRRRDRANRR